MTVAGSRLVSVVENACEDFGASTAVRNGGVRNSDQVFKVWEESAPPPLGPKLRISIKYLQPFQLALGGF